MEVPLQPSPSYISGMIVGEGTATGSRPDRLASRRFIPDGDVLVGLDTDRDYAQNQSRSAAGV